MQIKEIEFVSCHRNNLDYHQRNGLNHIHNKLYHIDENKLAQPYTIELWLSLTFSSYNFFFGVARCMYFILFLLALGFIERVRCAVTLGVPKFKHKAAVPKS